MKMHWSYKPKYGKTNNSVRTNNVIYALGWKRISKQMEWKSKGLIDKIVYTIEEYDEMLKKIKEPK